MTRHGAAKITAAKRLGNWGVRSIPIVDAEPCDELNCALELNEKAKRFFDQLPPSARKHFIAWINVAKRPATRETRIKESLALLEQGRRLGLK